MVSFPAPVGGVPFEEDFAPSVIFAVVFAILVFLGVYRLARASTRTLVILAPLIFCTERVVTWSLRAKQAKTPSEELDRNLTIYWQVAFAAAYMTIWTCLVNILRCVLVATTKGSKTLSYTAPLSYTNDYALPTEEDRPRARFWYRRVLGVIAFASWITVITGTLLGYNYVNAENDASKGQSVETLRRVKLSFMIMSR
ncbi:hypothetical protein PHLGIDRAFT_72441 [Phlebiopsis gigantea 11061_1 CR5-6]|uniref:Uncharacterized protein n=1 Tax=Phlebiopsis gigantea (strain 11061_1 CR5-6) TaxID=745531 RepID=A0A0C3S775_PHLG1|nr:hypothetical protein PHLGIDRAFT_72441 [Phlebiopsis gigantea 11061_1 CR5-6]